MFLSADNASRLTVSLVSGVLIFCCGAVTHVAAEEAVLPMHGLRFPLEHYTNGAIRMLVIAGKAVAQPGKPVVAEDVTIEFNAPDGAVETRIEMVDCVVERNEQRLDSSGPVAMKREGVQITGKGLIWTGTNEIIEILNDVRVELDRSVDAKDKFSLF